MSSRRASEGSIAMSTAPVSLRRPPPSWPGSDAEELLDPRAPLVGEGFAVDEDQGGGAALGDHGAGHDGLAGSGWGDEQPVVVGEQRADRGALPGGEFGGERDVDLLAGVSYVGDGQPRSGLFDDRGDGVAQPAGQDQAVVEGEVVAADEPRGVPGGLP